MKTWDQVISEAGQQRWYIQNHGVNGVTLSQQKNKWMNAEVMKDVMLCCHNADFLITPAWLFLGELNWSKSSVVFFWFDSTDRFCADENEGREQKKWVHKYLFCLFAQGSIVPELQHFYWMKFLCFFIFYRFPFNLEVWLLKWQDISQPGFGGQIWWYLSLIMVNNSKHQNTQTTI